MSIKLLIADDAPFILEVTRALVEGPDIEVVGEAVDGIEAVKLALELEPDVIFMDMVMPGKNGVDATSDILAQNPNVKIIAFSTLDDDFMKEQALSAGCCDYIRKPFTKEILLKSLSKATGLELS